MPFKVHPIDDDDTVVAIVRYDGDPDVFAALAYVWLRANGYDRAIQPPDPRLYRMIPDPSREYRGTFVRATRPGAGAFLGAHIELAPWPPAVCINRDTGQRRSRHDWPEQWTERPNDMPATRRNDVARFRYCHACNAVQAVEASGREIVVGCR